MVCIFKDVINILNINWATWKFGSQEKLISKELQIGVCVGGWLGAWSFDCKKLVSESWFWHYVCDLKKFT